MQTTYTNGQPVLIKRTQATDGDNLCTWVAGTIVTRSSGNSQLVAYDGKQAYKAAEYICKTEIKPAEPAEPAEPAAPELRAVSVQYANGTTINTSMAAHLTDDQIKAYYRIGKMFNVGSGGTDELTTVQSVTILN